MSRVLIDTHVLIWSLLASRRLSARALRRIEAADVVLVSAASFYEIEFKRRVDRARSRKDDLAALPATLLDHVQGLGLAVLPISPEQAVMAANLPIAHGDPWDRILLAQARDLDVPLISADAVLRRHAGDVPVIW
jgi:PIN domain nuclease of toxin-antitoxin system